MKKIIISIFLLPLFVFGSEELSIRNSIELSWASQSGLVYQVQYSTNLSEEIWTNLGDPIICRQPCDAIIHNLADSPHKFHRVIKIGDNSENSAIVGQYKSNDFPIEGTTQWNFYTDGTFTSEVITDVYTICIGTYAYSSETLILIIEYSTDPSLKGSVQILNNIRIVNGNLVSDTDTFLLHSLVYSDFQTFWDIGIAPDDKEATPE